MKVIWFSNCSLSGKAISGSGSWLFAMRDLIAKDVALINITNGGVNNIYRREGNGIIEYLLPSWKLNDGVPTSENIKKISKIIKDESPDLIHIWGVEKYWALLFSRGLVHHDKVLLEIQGVVSACVDVFYGGLAPKEYRQLHSLKSIFFKWSKLSYIFHIFQKQSVYESELIRYFHNISVQSLWTKEQLSTLCSNNTDYFFSLRPIRQDFCEAKKWNKVKSDNIVVFSSFSYYIPFKGLHFLLKAISLLRALYPSITLRIAGPDLSKRHFYDATDYERFIIKEIKRLKLDNNIYFCGSLQASQMIEEILNADVVVNPSLVESFSAAAAEALYLGAPTVLAYAGAMVNFSDERSVALYYNPMDYRSMAAKIHLLLEDVEQRKSLNKNAIEIMSQRCSPTRVKERQLKTYEKILYK